MCLLNLRNIQHQVISSVESFKALSRSNNSLNRKSNSNNSNNNSTPSDTETNFKKIYATAKAALELSLLLSTD